MPGTVHLDVLKNCRIASPCSARWEDMAGNDKRRHCCHCDLDVHNLAAMSGPEIDELLRTSGGTPCVRMYRRADGTVVTSDCPVGLAAVRAYARRAYARVALLVAALMGACVAMTPNDDPWYGERRLVLYQPFEWIAQTLAPRGAWNARWGGMTMGMICPPSAGALPPTVHSFDERAPDAPVESDACDEPESPSESNSPAPRAKPQEDGAKIE
jgi:hypothetical protein